MSVMERRLQILLDEARYVRLAAEADRSGRSVAAVIREAIDLRFPSGDESRLRAADQLLAMTAADESAGEDPAQLKAMYEQRSDEKPGAW